MGAVTVEAKRETAHTADVLAAADVMAYTAISGRVDKNR
jgi:hypothetical protein